MVYIFYFFFFQAEDGIRDRNVTGVQTCALPISYRISRRRPPGAILIPCLLTSLLPCVAASPVTSPQSPNVVSFHPVNILLNEVECRVLGSLIEKEITTPEYYPLSLNALVNACNQKSNRDPVMTLDEAAVRQALHSLDGQSLV